MFRTVFLPLALLLGSLLLLGCYYETNDDLVIIFLLRGTGLLAPASNMHLYFHGLAPLLSKLYVLLPALPWYGLLLYSMLATSAVLLFKVLDAQLAGLSNGRRIGVLCFFFFLAYTETIMRLNFTRPPIMLAGAVLLYTVHRLRLGQLRLGWVLLGSALVLLGWTVRSNGSFVGLLVTAPAVLLLSRGQRGRASLVVGWYAALLVGASLMLSATVAADKTQSSYEYLSTIRARINDYQMYTFHPRLPTDSVAFESVQPWWGIGDTTLVNRAFYQRATRVDLSFWARNVVPPKTASLLVRLAGDYFLIVFFNVLLIWGAVLTAPDRRAVWWWLLYTLFILGLLLGLGVGMQLPPRIATPVLALYTLVNFCYLFPLLRPAALLRSATYRLVGLGLAGVLTLAYAGKIAFRSYRHAHEKLENEQYLAQLSARVGQHPLIIASLYNSFRSLSPLKNYDLGGGPVYMLNGWTASDPSQQDVLRALAGNVPYHEAMTALAQRPDVVWAFPRGFNSFFTRYLSAFGQPGPTFCPVSPAFPDPAQADFPQIYRACPADR